MHQAEKVLYPFFRDVCMLKCSEGKIGIIKKIMKGCEGKIGILKSFKDKKGREKLSPYCPF